MSSANLLQPGNLIKININDIYAIYSTEEYAALIQRALDLTNDLSLGLQLDSMLNVVAAGNLDFLAMTAPTITDAIEAATSYFNWIFPFVTLDIQSNSNSFNIRFTEQN